MLSAIRDQSVIAGWSLLLLLCWSTASFAAGFNFLYLEANEGTASGGHSGLQFGDTVYHYQHIDSGYIRLIKDDAANFFHNYRFLQNRTVHSSRVAVADDTYRLINEHFSLRFQNQERLFKRLEELQKNRSFLQTLSGNSSNPHKLQFHGGGLFRQSSSPSFTNRLEAINKQSMSRLHTLIIKTYGTDFLANRNKQLEKSIHALTPGLWRNEFVSPIYTLADNFEDLEAERQAIRFIEQQRIPASDTFRHGETLTPAETLYLSEFQIKLQNNILQLLTSDRPDRAYPLLVNIARLCAVDASLQTRQWIFVDDFAETSQWLDPEDIPETPMLVNEARVNWLKAKSAINKLSEADYSRLEMLANRYAELQKAGLGKPFRFQGEMPLPDKPLALQIDKNTLPKLSLEQINNAINDIDRHETSLHQQLAHHNRYDLLNRNCVTELFRNIDAVFINSQELRQSGFSKVKLEQQTQKHLGGHIQADYNFIPWVAYQSVQNQLHVTNTKQLLSYRSLRLEKLHKQSDSYAQQLAEMTTLGSRWYHFNHSDGWFIFFTDDQPLLRPVLGGINTLTAIGQIVYGLLALPFDQGENLHGGVMGIFMSLPELVFINIRKGSYPYLPLSVSTSALSDTIAPALSR